MNSAQTTIRHPTVPPEHRSDQLGQGRSLSFTRDVDGLRLRAIVFVGNDGRAVLATYMPVPR